MPGKDTLDPVSLPTLVDFDLRVDVISSSNQISRISVPRCLLQLQVLDKGNTKGTAEEEKPSNITVELSKETLDTMLDGLGKIRDQLNSVVSR
ncbi:COMM domain-containing protein 9-like [Clytia hemisphaerica]|uniref:COMM domain-containing protein 9-like n=1 Tax=Clytia hemisphaerica TaxID=252671 RepID=UPI0034D513C7